MSAKFNKSAKMALYRSPDYQTSFVSVDLSVQEKNFNVDFQDGGHLAYQVSSQLTFRLRRRSEKKIFKMAAILDY